MWVESAQGEHTGRSPEDNGMDGQKVSMASRGETSSDSVVVARMSYFLWHGSQGLKMLGG